MKEIVKSTMRSMSPELAQTIPGQDQITGTMGSFRVG